MWTSNLWGVLQPGTWWLRCQPEAMGLCVTAQWQNRKRSQENGTCWQNGKTINLIQKFMMEAALSTKALICGQMAHPEFKLLSRNVPEKSLVMAIDFAENFTCFSQHEFQGANWAHDAVTIHPAITYYNCTKLDDHAVIEVCVHVISDDWSTWRRCSQLLCWTHHPALTSAFITFQLENIQHEWWCSITLHILKCFSRCLIGWKWLWPWTTPGYHTYL